MQDALRVLKWNDVWLSAQKKALLSAVETTALIVGLEKSDIMRKQEREVRKRVGGGLKTLGLDGMKWGEAKRRQAWVSMAVDEQMSVGRSGRPGKEAM